MKIKLEIEALEDLAKQPIELEEEIQLKALDKEFEAL